MTFKVSVIALVAVWAPAAASAAELTAIARTLKNTACYADSARYEVLLQAMEQPVVYTVGLASSAPADSLSPCRYIIEWQLPAPSGLSKGFSAYFDGDHYRFRDRRLQEYHVADNPVPFAPAGRKERGVQQQAQFADLLPQYIATAFERMGADTTYAYTVSPDTVVDGRRAVVVEGERRANGVTATEFTYILDPDTYLPRRILLENNPGGLGEQSIAVTYGSSPGTKACSVNYDTLLARHPDAFELYRESTFTLEKLPGQPLPRIAAPTTTGERYLHERGASFAAPTVVAFVDADAGVTPAVVADVRQAVAMLPFQVDVVWAFGNHRVDDIEAVVERAVPGEFILMAARGAARNCGVGATMPVLIFTATDGTVSDIEIGYNKDLASNVIQKATAAKHARGTKSSD